MDPVANFPYSFIDTPPDPAVSGTVAKLRGGGASVMPRGGNFNLVVWRPGIIATNDVSEIWRLGAIVEGTIDAGMDGATFPLDPGEGGNYIVVDSPTGDFNEDGGTAGIELADGTTTFVTYTGWDGTNLSGVLGGVGTLSTGDRITDDWISFDRAQEGTIAKAVGKNWQVLAAITKAYFDSITTGTPTAFYTNVAINIAGLGNFNYGNEGQADLGNNNEFSTAFATPPSDVDALGYLPFPDMEVDNAPTATDGYDIYGRIYIRNADGTQVIIIDNSGFVDIGEGGGGIDWSTATVVFQVGTDLVYDPDNGIQSTAGGQFFGYYYMTGGPD